MKYSFFSHFLKFFSNIFGIFLHCFGRKKYQFGQSCQYKNSSPKPAITDCTRILLVRLSALGDVSLTLPLLPLLKERGCFVGWVIQEQNAELVQNHPLVDRVYQVPWKRWKSHKCAGHSWRQVWREYLALVRQIRADHYQVVIDAQGLFKSLIFAATSGAFYHIANRAAREGASFFATHRVDLKRDPKAKALCLPHIFLRYLAPLGITRSPTQPLNVSLPPTPLATQNKIDQLIKNFQLSQPVTSATNIDRSLVVIAPTTTWPTKHWNAQHWQQLIAQLPSHWQLIFTGNQQSLSLIRRLARPQDLVLAGQTNLTELIALFRQSKLVISLDSGSTHLAWAAQAPKILAIYCATNRILYSDPPQTDRYQAIAGRTLTCQPCCRRRCPLTNSQHNACTDQPAVHEALNAALMLMKKT